MLEEAKNSYEHQFQEVIHSDLSKQANRDRLYYLLDYYCSNQVKKLLKGIRISPEQFELRYGEAVLELFEKIVIRGVRPNKLSSYGYWPCKRALINKTAIQEDAEVFDIDNLGGNI